MYLEERKIVDRPRTDALDYLGRNSFEWGIEFSIFCIVYTTVYHLDHAWRRPFLLRVAYPFRLGSAEKLQAVLSLWVCPGHDGIMKCKEA